MQSRNNQAKLVNEYKDYSPFILSNFSSTDLSCLKEYMKNPDELDETLAEKIRSLDNETYTETAFTLREAYELKKFLVKKENEICALSSFTKAGLIFLKDLVKLDKGDPKKRMAKEDLFSPGRNSAEIDLEKKFKTPAKTIMLRSIFH